MTRRVWDRFLTESDLEHVARAPVPRRAVGGAPALLLVDVYRWAFGDEPAPIMDAVKDWPGSCGMAAWDTLPRIVDLLQTWRAAGLPVVHVTGLDGIPGLDEVTPRGARPTDPVMLERYMRRFDLLDELSPAEGELVIRKAAPSAFWGTPLVGYLRHLGIDTVVISGESTSGCVRATVVDARSHRYQVIVVEDCVFDRHEAPHAISLFDMDQKYASVVERAIVKKHIRHTGGTVTWMAGVVGEPSPDLAIAARAVSS